MAKFFGKIGYAETKETAPDVWTEEITESEYYGDILSNQSRWESGNGKNDDTKINAQISIVADEYALKKFHLMRYVKWMDVKWKITSINPQHPRIILSLGGVYNGK